MAQFYVWESTLVPWYPQRIPIFGIKHNWLSRKCWIPTSITFSFYGNLILWWYVDFFTLTLWDSVKIYIFHYNPTHFHITTNVIANSCHHWWFPTLLPPLSMTVVADHKCFCRQYWWPSQFNIYLFFWN